MKFEIPSDLKRWYAISCPRTGLRFDSRTLEFLDSDGDGRIRSEELSAALELVKTAGYAVESLFEPDESLAAALADNLARQDDLGKVEPTDEERQALADWEAKGKVPEVAVAGDATADANAALAAVEEVVDGFFAPPEDMPLVTEDPDVELPLRDHLNPKHLEAVLAFAEKCVKPILGEKASLTRMEWKELKARLAPYRAWAAAKPETNSRAKAELVAEERILRYRLYLGEFLINYVTMDRLYGGESPAIFQTGVLRIDGKEMNLCFHVESEAAHSALADRSKCCVIYLKLTRPADGATRQICAVVTAGTIGGLYVGRNGVFYDRDGKDWDATITKVVEAQVSLLEAFWSPWRKLGAGIAATAKKFLGERQSAADAKLAAGAQKVAAGKAGESGGGAAMASSIAAIGIGVGILGAAAASLMAAISKMTAWQIAGAVVAIILVVSLPSVILTYFNLRKRDLGAVLNAGGWAVNREMRFSMKRARGFTKCAPPRGLLGLFVVFALVIAFIVGGSIYSSRRAACASEPSCAPAAEQAPAEAASAAPAAPAAEAAK